MATDHPDPAPSQGQMYSSQGKPPIPDPTVLTTQALEREISHLRELLETSIKQVSLHLDAADKQLDARVALQITDLRNAMNIKFAEQDRATRTAREAADKAIEAARNAAETAITEFDASITRRLALQNDVIVTKFEGVAKEFITYKSYLDNNASAAGIALNAADKAVNAAFASSKEAINKAEVYNEKRFEQLTNAVADIRSAAFGYISRNEFEQLRTDTTEKIDDLKKYRDTTSGKGQGSAAMWGYVAAGIFLLIAVITFMNSSAFSGG